MKKLLILLILASLTSCGNSQQNADKNNKMDTTTTKKTSAIAQKITPCLWVDKDAKAVANYYLSIFKDGKLKESFANTITNIEKISADVRDLVEDVKNKKGTLGKFFYDDSLYTKTEEFIDDLKQNPWKLLHKPKDAK